MTIQRYYRQSNSIRRAISHIGTRAVLVQIIFVLMLSSCRTSNESVTNDDPANEQLSYLLEEDVHYADGLSHESFNSARSETLPLYLDIYGVDEATPSTLRPLLMFVHGGGFFGGTKQKPEIVSLAEYFVERGFVVASINYRVSEDRGTVPQAWLDYAPSVAENADPEQFLAMYPAHRDAKAALRYLVAKSETYGIDTNRISVGGASAGAIIAVTLGISAAEDFTDELSIDEDPTLSTTHREQAYSIKTIIDFWGSGVALEAQESIYGHQRFNVNNPPLLIVHGTEDPTVPFAGAEALKAEYDSNGIPIAYYPAEGLGHGIWNWTSEGKRIEELAYDFIIEQQGS